MIFRPSKFLRGKNATNVPLSGADHVARGPFGLEKENSLEVSKFLPCACRRSMFDFSINFMVNVSIFNCDCMGIFRSPRTFTEVKFFSIRTFQVRGQTKVSKSTVTDKGRRLKIFMVTPQVEEVRKKKKWTSVFQLGQREVSNTRTKIKHVIRKTIVTDQFCR